jgi:hypothetical protein
VKTVEFNLLPESILASKKSSINPHASLLNSQNINPENQISATKILNYVQSHPEQSVF